MQRSLYQTLSILFVLVLSASLLPMGDLYARGRGGGGGGRGGGGAARSGGSFSSSGRGGGGASPRVDRSVSTQNRGNFNNPSQQDRQGQRTERTDIRQGERTQRQGERQGEITNRQNNRQNFVDNNYGNWRGGGWYGGGYYVPPGWGWAGLATGLVIGAAVATAPPYYDTVYVGSTSYIYSDGIYMQPNGDTYTVIAPPVGAVVNYLPDGCTTNQINNTTYYNCSGIYYQPFFQNGSTVYQVVQL